MTMKSNRPPVWLPPTLNRAFPSRYAWPSELRTTIASTLPPLSYVCLSQHDRAVVVRQDSAGHSYYEVRRVWWRRVDGRYAVNPPDPVLDQLDQLGRAPLAERARAVILDAILSNRFEHRL